MTASVSSGDTQPQHLLIVTEDQFGEWEYEVQCPGLSASCESWTLCLHDDHAPLSERLMKGTAHGVEHRQFDFGWAVRSGQCFVADHDRLVEVAEEYVASQRLGCGTHPVGFSCDDETELRLTLSARPAGSPVVSP